MVVDVHLMLDLNPTVMVACRVFPLVCRQLIQPLLQFLFQCRGHEDGTAGGCGFGAFQDEGSGAAFQLVREYLDDAAIVHLIQGFFSHPLHGLVDTECSDAIRSVKILFLLQSVRKALRLLYILLRQQADHRS